MIKKILAVLFSALVLSFAACASSAPVQEPADEYAVEAEAVVDTEEASE